jgi:hypothetical protein
MVCILLSVVAHAIFERRSPVAYRPVSPGHPNSVQRVRLKSYERCPYLLWSVVAAHLKVLDALLQGWMIVPLSFMGYP